MSAVVGRDYLHNAWYQAAWSDELTDSAPLARTVFETPLVLFRGSEGRAVAMLDRCPHRFAPLSRGTLAAGTLTCGYHGLSFNSLGQCVQNPHGPIPPRAQVQVFPTLERHEALWVWMGEPEQADSTTLPDFGFIDTTPASAKFRGLMTVQANYQLVADNVLDLSHVAYLHPTTFGDVLMHARMSIEGDDRTLRARWESKDVKPSPAYQGAVPEGNADIWAVVNWHAPALLVIDSGAVPTGSSRAPRDSILALHSLTPAGPSSTHYFYCITRGVRTEDAEFNAQLKSLAELAFNHEDKPMIEAQQARLAQVDLSLTPPLLLSVDGAAVRARRILGRLIAAEREIPPTRQVESVP